MDIYNYSQDTHEYLDSMPADLDPMATKREGKDVYLVPAYATLKKPPKTGQYKISCFEDNTWIVKDDYRNEYACDPAMNVIFITQIGPLPDNYIRITQKQAETIAKDSLYSIIVDNKLVKNPNYDEQKLAQAKEDKLKEALTKANDFINNDAAYRFDNQNTIEATDGNIGKFTAYALGFTAGTFEEVEWTSKEDNLITLNQEDCLRVLTGLGAIQSSVWNVQYIAFKTAINEAETIKEVEEIEVHYGC